MSQSFAVDEKTKTSDNILVRRSSVAVIRHDAHVRAATATLATAAPPA
jgi:hypothetical protein